MLQSKSGPAAIPEVNDSAASLLNIPFSPAVSMFIAEALSALFLQRISKETVNSLAALPVRFVRVSINQPGEKSSAVGWQPKAISFVDVIQA